MTHENQKTEFLHGSLPYLFSNAQRTSTICMDNESHALRLLNIGKINVLHGTFPCIYIYSLLWAITYHQLLQVKSSYFID